MVNKHSVHIHLAVQFWDLCCICDQIGKTIAEVWDGQEVKLTFGRTFSPRMMERWFELSEVVVAE